MKKQILFFFFFIYCKFDKISYRSVINEKERNTGLSIWIPLQNHNKTIQGDIKFSKYKGCMNETNLYGGTRVGGGAQSLSYDCLYNIYKEEFSFINLVENINVGDAIIFNRNTWHRTNILLELNLRWVYVER